MNCTIKNSYAPNFNGLKNNNCLRQARAYAKDSGQKEIFKNAQNIVNILAGDSLSLNVRANKHPIECMHVTILNKNYLDKDKFIGRIEYFYPGNDSIGKATFEALKSLADKTSDIHNAVFNK